MGVPGSGAAWEPARAPRPGLVRAEVQPRGEGHSVPTSLGRTADTPHTLTGRRSPCCRVAALGRCRDGHGSRGATGQPVSAGHAWRRKKEPCARAVGVAWPAGMEKPAPGVRGLARQRELCCFGACLLERPRDPRRFARNETHLRPGSPTPTLVGDTGHVVAPATCTPSRLGPGRADPFLPWDGPSPPRGAPHKSAHLGPAQSQPWARVKFEGPSGGVRRVPVTNGKPRRRCRRRVDCRDHFLFVVSRSSPP